MKLKKVALRTWVKALRSGKYRQATGTLYRNKPVTTLDGTIQRPCGYCCLGVYGKLAGAPDEVLCGGIEGGKKVYAAVSALIGASAKDTCIALNDGTAFADFKQYTFSEIADYLETLVAEKAKRK